MSEKKAKQDRAAEKEAMIEDLEKQLVEMGESKGKRIEWCQQNVLDSIRNASEKALTVRGMEAMYAKANELGGNWLKMDQVAERCIQLHEFCDMMLEEFGDMDLTDKELVEKLLEDWCDRDFVKMARCNDHGFADMVCESSKMDVLAATSDVLERLWAFCEEAEKEVAKVAEQLEQLKE